jgi:hypothetical protein
MGTLYIFYMTLLCEEELFQTWFFNPLEIEILLDFTLGSITVYYREISLIRPNQIGIPTLVSGKTST